MRALVKSRPEPGLWFETIEAPTIGPNDLLVRVRRASICGTDLHIRNWDAWAQRTIRVPLVIGHEFEGEIVTLGTEVSGFELGARVAVEGHVTWYQMGVLLQSGLDITSVVTHRFPATHFAEAFEVVRTKNALFALFRRGGLRVGQRDTRPTTHTDLPRFRGGQRFEIGWST